MAKDIAGKEVSVKVLLMWLTPPLRDTSWMIRGTCVKPFKRGVDVHFPQQSTTGYAAKKAAALAMCAVCPVKAECLEDALATGEKDGIRGELTASQRRPLLKARVQAKREQAAADVPAGTYEIRENELAQNPAATLPNSVRPLASPGRLPDVA
jgi:WhiB family redox-sensing transcriptional regulator